MSHEKWNLIKKRKGFYIALYRHLGSVLVIFIALNLILGLCVAKAYFGRPEHQFYATNGVSNPLELTPMDEANMTSVALLPDDPVDDLTEKVIPQ